MVRRAQSLRQLGEKAIASIKQMLAVSLSRQLAAVILLAFTVSCCLYFGLSLAANQCICAYYAWHPETVQRRADALLDKLQTDVGERGIGFSDSTALSAWVNVVSGRELMILQIYRNGVVTFDSTERTTARLHSHMMDPIPQAQQSVRTIQFADGSARAAIALFPENAQVERANILLMILCMSLFLGTVLLSMRGKIRRLSLLEKEVLAIAGGELDRPLTQRGIDELSNLAVCVDGMRGAFVERIHQEESRQMERDQWITMLSHDLRTPLTILTGYLEVSLRQPLPENTRFYLTRCMDQALRLKERSDLLFAGFADSAPLFDNVKQAEPEAFFTDYLRDQITYLKENGYSVELDYEAPARSTTVQPAAFQRVLENVFVNITKYAAVDQPVAICARTDQQAEGSFMIAITSGGDKAAGFVGSGLGLTICANLMSHMGGAFGASASDGCFTYRITLPYGNNIKESSEYIDGS
ncbi:MAG: HAMP domain-containing histidine kinase [Oscillospiraceae bacterium]|jgi:signal transduction histidine kinase|nr:HAMP domain-containing histidine kinase [Oscillospiraceae bacterium]